MSQVFKRGKNTSWRIGLMRNLATELIMHNRLEITATCAKELKKHVDKLITLGKQGDLHARREALKFVRPVGNNKDNAAINKLFGELAKKYAKRKGGYTRILKTDNRPGDNALMAIIELV